MVAPEAEYTKAFEKNTNAKKILAKAFRNNSMASGNRRSGKKCEEYAFEANIITDNELLQSVAWKKNFF